MGSRGPVPNRSDDLARPRERKGGDAAEVAITKGELRGVVVPEPDKDWHKISLMLWDSLIASGQSDFYQQSDWAFAYSLCDDLSAYKSAGKWGKDGEWYEYRSPEMLKALLSAMSNLLVTEADRRRVRIELTSAPDDEEAPVLELMSEYQDGLAGPKEDA